MNPPTPMFFRLTKDLKNLHVFLSVDSLFSNKHYQIQSIKSLEDIAPAINQRIQQANCLDEEIIEWLFTKPTSSKFKSHVPSILRQLPKEKISYFYLKVANIAATGLMSPASSDWKWEEKPNNTLTIEYLDLAIEHLSQQHTEGLGRNTTDNLKLAICLRDRAGSNGIYSKQELNDVWSESVFFNVISQSLPDGLEALNLWGCCGHNEASALLASTKESKSKWEALLASLPSYPISIGDNVLHDDQQTQEWLRDEGLPTLCELYPSVTTKDWLTITQNLSGRAADSLAVDCWRAHHCTSPALPN